MYLDDSAIASGDLRHFEDFVAQLPRLLRETVAGELAAPIAGGLEILCAEQMQWGNTKHGVGSRANERFGFDVHASETTGLGPDRDVDCDRASLRESLDDFGNVRRQKGALEMSVAQRDRDPRVFVAVDPTA